MNYPALIKSYSGTIYHITDDGCKTRCGRRIDAHPETHALALDDEERCRKCGTVEQFDAISDARAAEDKAAHEEHLRKLAEIVVIHAARSAVRPDLVTNIIISLVHLVPGLIQDRVHLNMTELRFPTEYKGQRFTVKIEVWNGDHE